MASDQASQSRFVAVRVSPMLDSILDFDRTSRELTQYLISTWRVNKASNRDSTYAVASRLRVGRYEGEEDETFIVLNAMVSPEGIVGERSWVCNVVLCMGKPYKDNRIEFSYCLHRSNRIALADSVLAFVRSKFDCVDSSVQVSPHSLAFLASEWTRDNEAEDDVDEEGGEDEDGNAREKGKKQKRSQHIPLKIEFAMDKAVRDDGLHTIKLTVEQPQVKALHDYVLKSGEVPSADDPTSPFTRALCNYVTSQLKIHVSGLAIVAISTATADVTWNGSIKFKSVPGKRQLVQLAEAARSSSSTALMKQRLE